MSRGRTRLVGSNGGEYEIIAPLAYQGKKDCESARCTRWIKQDGDGGYDWGECMGWHCSYCDAPCSSQGHFNCEVGKTLRDEAQRIHDEDRP